MDGGGVPGWMTKTTKNPLQPMAKSTCAPMTLLTTCFYVRRFLAKLNYTSSLFSKGGPNLLENRPTGLKPSMKWTNCFGTKAAQSATRIPYGPIFQGLRDQLRADGIDIPLTTCPGDGKSLGHRRCDRIIPMPNVYIMAWWRKP